MAVKPMPVHGADISHHQSGQLDLPAAKRRGLKWLYHKATEGDTYTDPNYGKRRIEAARAGLPFGAYHFARPEKGDAEGEARRFIAVAKPRPGDLRPALDLETTEGLTLPQIRTWAKTFVDTVEKLTGVRPIVYTPFDLGDAVKGCLIWRPRYNNDNREPVLRWDIWQFSNGQFGVPNLTTGLGHVDLNVMRPGLSVADMQVPEPKPEPVMPKTLRLDLVHASMQYSDTPQQQRSDLEKIFERAEGRDAAWVTGTEAGALDFRHLIEDVADAHGYRLFARNANDSWIAIRRDLIKGGVEVEYEPLILTGEGVGHHGPRGVLSVSFDSVKELGRVTVLACHYLTKGRPGAKDPQYRANAALNKELAVKISELAREHGKGSALVFYAGDQNIVDRDEDTFMGGPLTSTWDELEKWENTGHGNIDVIASYDKDGRVTAAYCRALDDSEFRLFADHFVVESGFDVRVL